MGYSLQAGTILQDVTGMGYSLQAGTILQDVTGMGYSFRVRVLGRTAACYDAISTAPQSVNIEPRITPGTCQGGT
jgi:hypothetical protein